MRSEPIDCVCVTAGLSAEHPTLPGLKLAKITDDHQTEQSLPLRDRRRIPRKET